jgi:hypothetical protein
MESYCSLCTFKVPQGAKNLILCTLDTLHRLCFVARLIINQINKVQWVDFKLENVLVSLHSLKTMCLGSIIVKEWRVTWTFSYNYFSKCHLFVVLLSLNVYFFMLNCIHYISTLIDFCTFYLLTSTVKVILKPYLNVFLACQIFWTFKYPLCSPIHRCCIS